MMYAIKNKIQYVPKNENEYIQEIVCSNLPTIIFGAGDVAGRIVERIGNLVAIQALLVTVDCKKDEWNGIPIYDLSYFENTRNTYNVIIGFAKYNYAIEQIKDKKWVHKIYRFSHPFSTHEKMDYAYFLNHLRDYESVVEILYDLESRENLVAYLNAMINSDCDYITKIDESYFRNSVFSVGSEENYVDVGAYNGDTIRDFLVASDGKYENIYAFEPEEIFFELLSKYIYEKDIKRIKTFNLGCWNDERILKFQKDGTSSHFDIVSDSDGIKVNSLDNILVSSNVSLIKISIQEGVEETIIGAAEVIKKYHPKIVIVVGTRLRYVYEIPSLIKGICSEYKIYFRFLGNLPSRLVLIAV